MLRDYPTEKLLWWNCLSNSDSSQNRYAAQIPARLYPHRRYIRLKSGILDRLWVPLAARNLSKLIKTLKPEAIWHVPHKWAIPVSHRLLASLQKKLHVSMQDYMDMTANIPLLGKERAHSFAEMADDLYRNARTRDAISEPMIEDLLARTGAPAQQMLHAGLESSDFTALGSEPSPTREIRIAYAGTIQVESAFLSFLKAVDAVRHSLPARLKITFFSSHRYSAAAWFNADWMEDRGHLSVTRLHEELRQCSWGLSLMALDDDARYNRYSLPTKFVSYLAGGLPIFTLAHRESSVYRMAAKYSVGVQTCATETEQLSEELRRALSDLEAKARYRPAVLACARAKFDAEKTRHTLHGCFISCANA
jgi:hypothetical protein